MTFMRMMCQQRYDKRSLSIHYCVQRAITLSEGGSCISRDSRGVSVLAAGLGSGNDRPGLWTATRARERLVTVIEQAVQEEREANDDEEAADADRGRGALPGEGDEHHETEPDAHQGDAGAAVAPGRPPA